MIFPESKMVRTLRDHRRPEGRKNSSVIRAEKMVRSEVLEALPPPRYVEVPEGYELDLTSAYVIGRDVMHFEQLPALTEFLSMFGIAKGVKRMRNLKVSLFDRADYARAIRIDGVYTNVLAGYLSAFVDGFAAGDELHVELGSPIVTGVHEQAVGNRYVGFSFAGEGAHQIRDERRALRAGIPGYPVMTPLPHLSLLETTNQPLAEHLRDELASMALRGSIVVLGPPEMYKVEAKL